MIKDEAIREIINLYRGGVSKTGWSGGLRKEDVARWATVAEIDASAVFDLIAIEIAINYAARIYTWEFCDWIVNDLYDVLLEFHTTDDNFQSPNRFWHIYLAFDESEMASEGNVEKVARRNIENLLAEQES